jgi:hypothetical protein
MKITVYVEQPMGVDDLMAKTAAAFQKIVPKMLNDTGKFGLTL